MRQSIISPPARRLRSFLPFFYFLITNISKKKVYKYNDHFPMEKKILKTNEWMYLKKERKMSTALPSHFYTVCVIFVQFLRLFGAPNITRLLGILLLRSYLYSPLSTFFFQTAITIQRETAKNVGNFILLHVFRHSLHRLVYPSVSTFVLLSLFVPKKERIH